MFSHIPYLAVLYNNADGYYNITINTKATLTSSGAMINGAIAAASS